MRVGSWGLSRNRARAVRPRGAEDVEDGEGRAGVICVLLIDDSHHKKHTPYDEGEAEAPSLDRPSLYQIVHGCQQKCVPPHNPSVTGGTFSIQESSPLWMVP
jgi:hypothetical protein